MKEAIILVPSGNSAELMRSLARYGRKQMGVRFMSAVELARYALQLCGMPMKCEFLPRNGEPAVIYSFLADIPYFRSASYSDATNLASSLGAVRSLITENEAETMAMALSFGEFPDKNQAILEAYNRYMTKLNDQYLDSIGLIRMATAEARPFYADFCYISEFELSPIEYKLIDTLSGGKTKEICLCELFKIEKKQIHIDTYTESYGASNEVEHIIGEICRNNIPLDNCTVAITNTTEYAELFYEASVRHGIPMTFGCGVPILNANPARLLKALSVWDSFGYHGVEALRKVIFSDAFDRKKLMELLHIEHKKDLEKIVEIAGQLRISYNKNENEKVVADYKVTLTDKEKAEFLPNLALLANELSKGCEYLIKTYSVIRRDFAGRIDRSAVKVIADALDAFSKYAGKSVSEIIPDILNKTVCSENSREGSLYVTSIEGALSSMRENLYIAGLSASLFPGSAKENYLILDNDYLFFPNKEKASLSWRNSEKKKQKLFELITVSASLGVKTQLSYSGFSSSELKAQNPSSVLFEIYRAEHGERADIKEFETGFKYIGYFSENIGSSVGIGRAFVDGKKTQAVLPNELNADALTPPDRPFSPTAIEAFIECPMKFYLGKLLGIEIIEEYEPFTVITPKDVGTLAHNLMQLLADIKPTRDDFMAEAVKAFDTFLLSHPPLHIDAVDRERTDFVAMMLKAYDSDPRNEVIVAEEETTVPHPSGITLKGIPDRIEKTKDGEYIIVDFKTGRNIKHKDNDIKTCIQTLLYAYIAEQSRKITIMRCEYRYLREGKTVACEYNDETKAKLNDILTEFKTALDTCKFGYAEDCGYCEFADICDKTKKEEERGGNR